MSWLRSNWSRLVSGAAILAVASVAGLISYTHICDLTIALHQPVMVARLMPVGVDGLVTVGSVVLLQARRGERWLGWLGIGPGVAISLFANIESGIRYGWLAAVWAGIPAVSFFVACFILENWLKAQAKAGTTTTVPEAIEAVTSGDAPAIEPGNVDAGVPVDAAVDVPASTVPTVPADTALTVTSQRAPHRASKHASKAPERVFAAELERGELPSLRAVKTRMRVGTDRARTILADLQEAMSQPVDEVTSDAA